MRGMTTNLFPGNLGRGIHNFDALWLIFDVLYEVTELGRPVFSGHELHFRIDSAGGLVPYFCYNSSTSCQTVFKFTMIKERRDSREMRTVYA